jgi:hypothetical protein
LDFGLTSSLGDSLRGNLFDPEEDEMGLKNVIDEKVEIELGGKKFLLRFPVRAFREMQEQFGGWVKAWEKMGNRQEGSTMEGEINYETLAEMLVIGIHQEGVDFSKVSTWLNDLYQDELVEIINGMLKAKNKHSPEVKDKTVQVVEHLEAAKALLLADRREAEVSAFDELLDALKEEVADSRDDPPKQTA